MIATGSLRQKLLDLAVSGKLVPRTGEWRTVKLGDVCDVLTGNVFDSKGFSSSGIKICGGLIIAPGEIRRNECKYWPTSEGLDRYCLAAGDVVIALDRPWISTGTKIGLITESDLPCLLIQRTARLRSDQLDSKFLLALLCGEKFKAHCLPTGSMLPHISHKDIKSFPIPLPPLEEQKRIVARLEELLALEREIAADGAALDDLVAAARRKILDLAVSGKLVPRQGEWRTVKLKDVGVFCGGHTPSKAQKDFWGGECLWVTSKDMKQKYISDTQVKLTSKGADELESLPPGTLLMTVRSGILRRTFPVGINTQTCTINQDQRALRLYDFLDVEYAYVAMLANEQLILKSYIKSGTTVESIIWNKFLDFEIPLPTLAEQKAIVKRVDELMALLDAMKG